MATSESAKQTNLQRLMEFVLFIGTLVPLMFGAVWLGEQARLSQCPAGTFLAGSTRPDLLLGGLMLGVLPAFYLIRNELLARAPAARRLLGIARKRPRKRSGTDWAKVVRLILVSAIMIGMPLFFIAALSQFCLDSREILDRSWPWTAMHRHTWQDVVSIDTYCSSAGRGGWHISYFLVMRNRAAIEIASGERGFEGAYPSLRRALANSDYTFNVNFAPERCGYQYVDLLTTRP